MRNENEASRALALYADTVRRICLMHLKNTTDTEDVFQEVFLKYVLRDAAFESDEHEKAWIIRVTVNACRDVLKSFFHRNVTSIGELFSEPPELQPQETKLLEAVLALPEKYRDVIYLHYYEGYTAQEIGALLDKKENTIYTWLARARGELKKELGGDTLG
jgi:RNA polymerase sigma-70 factor (ECF subfamily)